MIRQRTWRRADLALRQVRWQTVCQGQKSGFLVFSTNFADQDFRDIPKRSRTRERKCWKLSIP